MLRYNTNDAEGFSVGGAVGNILINGIGGNPGADD